MSLIIVFQFVTASVGCSHCTACSHSRPTNQQMAPRKLINVIIIIYQKSL